MIVAIYGKSCSGKTILSNNLSKELSIPVRHCGDAVRRTAAERGISPEALLPQDHLNIDDESRRALQNHENLIIEGCFLDNVLIGSDAIMIQLQCNSEIRNARFQERNSGMTFEAREKGDLELKTLLYGDVPGRIADFTVDTTNLKTEETVMEVGKWLQGRASRP